MDTLIKREEALHNCHIRATERWTEHTRSQLKLKWDKTGRVVEVCQFDQYMVRMDGSGCATMRNSKFLRKFIQHENHKHPLSDFRFINPTPTMTNLSSVEPPTQPSSIQQSQPTTLPVAMDNTHKPSETHCSEDIRETPTTSLEVPNQPDTPSPTLQKMSLALRRLLDHNKKGLRE